MKGNIYDSLKIDIDNESLHIFLDISEDNICSVAYWHIDEVKEDAEVAISMLNAVQLYYENPKKLVKALNQTRQEISSNYNYPNSLKIDFK